MSKSFNKLGKINIYLATTTSQKECVQSIIANCISQESGIIYTEISVYQYMEAK